MVYCLSRNCHQRKIFRSWTERRRRVWVVRISTHFSYQSESWEESFFAGRTHEKVALTFFKNSWFFISKTFNVMTSVAEFFLLFLRMMIGWKQKDIPVVILTFFFGFDVSFNEFRPLVMMRVELLKNLFHGTVRRLKGMFLMLYLQRQMLQVSLKRWRKRAERSSWATASWLILFNRKLRVLFIFALILKAYDFKLIWDSIDHTFRNIQMVGILLFFIIQFHQKSN